VKHEVVVPGAGHLERVELEAAEPIDDAQHRFRIRREGARRIQEMAAHQEAACVVGRDPEIGERSGHRRRC
jgi:hypothetical protein